MPLEQPADVIVIGGGVSGLAAAAELGRRRKRVVLLEARDRLGGRLLMERRRGWPGPIELGAQFVHAGNAPFWRMLTRHRIATTRVPDRHWHFGPSGLARIDSIDDRIALVTEKIEPRKMRGWSFADFTRAKAASLPEFERSLATAFVEGFEAAPCDEMSAVAVAGESLDPAEQFRLPGGYDRVVTALTREAREVGVRIVTGTPCRRVEWRRHSVNVETTRGRWTGRAVVVTVPLGVLQASPRATGAIVFSPRLQSHEPVWRAMGMGHVIRVNLRLDARRWRRVLPAALRDDAPRGFGFIHSRLENVPVWWSLTCDAVLTGWAGGPDARRLAGRTDAQVRAAALAALAQWTGAPLRELRAVVLDFATHNWTADPFSRGAYSFTRAGQDDAASRLRQPVDGTIYFAGEATADGEEVGTAHGALASGLRAAQEILGQARPRR